MGGSQIWFEPGEQMTVDELMRAVATVSANDASVALGEHVAGSHEGFVAMMNQRASELGMTRTHFANATGLDAPGHETTARDIARMSAELLRYPDVFRYTTIWMDELRGGETLLVNTNKLVRFYAGATGLKTGTTSGAGHCLSATALRDDMHLIAVVLGSDTGDQRFSAARGLLDYGFANYELVETPGIPGGAQPVKVTGGVAPKVAITPEAPPTLLVPKGRGKDVTQEVEIADLLTAPVEAGRHVGRVRLSLDGEEIATYPLVTAEELGEMTFLSAMGILIKEACNIG
jgi:D-alanyl-D-alanine carboxypeptidase (penicillin-binding protein 5/6)